ncbi:hypothetical protein [Novosphingopyxis sp. YJ-S2-01]|uniref:hypothetical protein n=1 Tax=Novosphingopyxis sp. YJ-S2-01 TaxID=2794021 RepID=UPI0018DE0ABA|nr:hypothetical protein [Novosphingopyxis sp. YJ-S2-01]MBH9538515.1 hypothetical protein [Novosphingopyxis sp. YJ-S2-01]
MKPKLTIIGEIPTSNDGLIDMLQVHWTVELIAPDKVSRTNQTISGYNVCLFSGHAKNVALFETTKIGLAREDTPISLALGQYETRLGDAEPFEALICTSSADGLAAALLNWLPPSMEGARKIEELFGINIIGPMLVRLRHELSSAAGNLRENRLKPGEAHRIAGLVGTLGFAEANRYWRALDEGHSSARYDAYRSARTLALALSLEKLSSPTY